MDDPLEEAKEVLNDLEGDLKKKKKIWKKLRGPNPDWEEVSEENWVEKQTRCWLHGATDTREANELERWLFDTPPLTATAQTPAKNVRRAWKRWLQKKGSFGAYYSGYKEFKIRTPQKNEILIHYVMRLARSAEDDGKGHRLAWRALKSFLGFIRITYPVQEVAFIEHIFPKIMDVFHGSIIRIIPPEKYPIPEKTASEILIELAQRCRNGRPDAQLTAAESLGLCWLCITASRIRLPIHFKTVIEIKSTAVQPGPELPLLQVPTWFGNRPVKISHRVSRFLNALSRIPSKKPRKTILQRSSRRLTLTFEKALKNVAPKPEYGNITYSSLLNQPHVFGDYRLQPKHLSTN